MGNTVEVRASTVPDISYSNKSNNSQKLSTTPTPVATSPSPASGSQPSPRKGPDTVDSFVPDLGDFDNFLSEDSSRDAVREERSLQEGEVSSDDEEGGNPMVARYDDMVDIGSYAGVNGSSMVAAQDDSSDEEVAKPVIKKPQENLDDFLDDFSAQPGDYEAL